MLYRDTDLLAYVDVALGLFQSNFVIPLSHICDNDYNVLTKTDAGLSCSLKNSRKTWNLSLSLINLIAPEMVLGKHCTRS